MLEFKNWESFWNCENGGGVSGEKTFFSFLVFCLKNVPKSNSFIQNCIIKAFLMPSFRNFNILFLKFSILIQFFFWRIPFKIIILARCSPPKTPNWIDSLKWERKSKLDYIQHHKTQKISILSEWSLYEVVGVNYEKNLHN